MSLKVGSAVYSTWQGLGVLAKSFYDNGIITDVCVVAHGRRKDNLDWYPNSPVIYNLKTEVGTRDMYELCAQMDVMLFFETPFDWELLKWCKEIGTKTVLVPMYECMPRVLPEQPDLIINPSLLDQRYYPQGIYLPIPVSVPWRKREKALTFVHNSGHGGLKGRNGTLELIHAIRLVKSPANFIIRCQDRYHWPPYSELLGKVELREGTFPYETLFQEGDVFIHPTKFDGLSLPLQEARASGMLVITLDRFPMNEWLPNDPLITTRGDKYSSISPRCNTFKEAVIDPKDIAKKIDEYYGKDISSYSLQGKQWAESMSWERWRPEYTRVLTELKEKK